MVEGKQLKLAIKGKGMTMEKAAELLGISRTTLYTYFLMADIGPDILQNVRTKLELDFTTSKITGADLRLAKAVGVTEQKGIKSVPIGAQANYTRHFTDPVFENQLERFYIPGFPYDGDNFLAWQMEGDSMTYINEITGREEGLLDREWIITELTSAEHWNSIKNWYIYAIVTETLVTIKRLFRLNEFEFVMIPDNPAYQQEILDVKDVSQLWIFKRKLEWNVPPPRRYEITVQSKRTEQ